jgi:hypothetical protein
MTWQEFKRRVEAQGVRDATVIAWIDVIGSQEVTITPTRDDAVMIASPKRIVERAVTL